MPFDYDKSADCGAQSRWWRGIALGVVTFLAVSALLLSLVRI
jgi:hypothetical protein